MKRHQSTRPDRPVAVGYEAGDVVVTLANGEVLRTPLSLHPWLEQATPEQRANLEFDPSAVYWPDLDDGLDIEWMRQQVNAAKTVSKQELLDRVRRFMDRDPQAQTLVSDFIAEHTQHG